MSIPAPPKTMRLGNLNVYYARLIGGLLFFPVPLYATHHMADDDMTTGTLAILYGGGLAVSLGVILLSLFTITRWIEFGATVRACGPFRTVDVSWAKIARITIITWRNKYGRPKYRFLMLVLSGGMEYSVKINNRQEAELRDLFRYMRIERKVNILQ